WAEHTAPKNPLSGPSAEAKRLLVDVPIDYATGNRVAGGGFIEHFRRDATGQIEDTQYQLASRDGYYYGDHSANNAFSSGENNRGPWIGRSYYPNWRSPFQPPPMARGFFQPWNRGDNPFREFFWGGRVN